jgi:uncharacterized Ntn-hydrolase superfamily protein
MVRLVIFAALVLSTARAHATYSIVGADRIRKQVGIAVTSCVPFPVTVVAGSSPGNGFVAAQALVNENGRDRAVDLLAMKTPPTEILTALTSPTFDTMFNDRQYGIVDVMGRTATFTGTNAQAYAGARKGANATYAYAAQGNILTSQKVIDQAAMSFEQKGCDLAERLILALEAGAVGGEGDSRCRPTRPGSSAYLAVDQDGMPAGQYLAIEVTAATGDPLEQVRAMYDVWRGMNPCPGTIPDGGFDLMEPPDDMTTSTPKMSGGCSCDLARPMPFGNLGWLLLIYPVAYFRSRSRR